MQILNQIQNDDIGSLMMQKSQKLQIKLKQL